MIYVEEPVSINEPGAFILAAAACETSYIKAKTNNPYFP